MSHPSGVRDGPLLAGVRFLPDGDVFPMALQVSALLESYIGYATQHVLRVDSELQREANDGRTYSLGPGANKDRCCGAFWPSAIAVAGRCVTSLRASSSITHFNGPDWPGRPDPDDR